MTTRSDALHTWESERAILGGCMLDPRLTTILGYRLLPEHFHQERHQRLWRLMLDMARNGQPTELLAVLERLRPMTEEERQELGGPAYIGELLDNMPSTENLDFYAGLVIEAHQRRVIDMGARLIIEAVNSATPMPEVLAMADRLAHGAGNEDATSKGYMTHQEVMDRAVRDHILANLDGNGPGMVSEGYEQLSSHLGNLPGDVTVWMGPTSSGKTTLMYNYVRGLALRGYPGAVVTIETTPEAIAIKDVAHSSGVAYGLLMKGMYDPMREHAIGEAVEACRGLPVLWNDDAHSSFTPEQLVRYIRRLATACQQQYGQRLRWVAIDYLQLIRPDRTHKGLTDAIGDLMGLLKTEVGKPLQLSVHVASQARRDVLDGRECHRLHSADGAYCSGIEQKCQNLVGLYRPGEYVDTYPGVALDLAEAAVFKSKLSASKTSVYLEWNGAGQRFSELPESMQGQHWRDFWARNGLPQAEKRARGGRAV